MKTITCDDKEQINLKDEIDNTDFVIIGNDSKVRFEQLHNRYCDIKLIGTFESIIIISHIPKSNLTLTLDETTIYSIGVVNNKSDDSNTLIISESSNIKKMGLNILNFNIELKNTKVEDIVTYRYINSTLDLYNTEVGCIYNMNLTKPNYYFDDTSKLYNSYNFIHEGNIILEINTFFDAVNGIGYIHDILNITKSINYNESIFNYILSPLAKGIIDGSDL